MLTPYQYRLAHKRGMPPQRTPGQPNSFSAHSVSSVADADSSGIPPCLNARLPQYFFRKNKAKSKMEKLPCLRNITHLPSATSPGVCLPLMPWCLDHLAPFRKNKPKSKMENLPCPQKVAYPLIFGHRPASASPQCLDALVPRCLDPFSKKQSQKQHGETAMPAHTYPSSVRDLPRCLDASVPQCLATPFRRNKPNDKIGNLSETTHTKELITEMARRL